MSIEEHQREIEEEIDAQRADRNAWDEAHINPPPSTSKETSKIKASAEAANEESERDWTPSPLEEQHSAVLGELYELYRRDVNGPMEFNAIPEEVHQKVEVFFKEHTKNFSPTDTVPESEVETFLAELGVIRKNPDAETMPTVVEIDEQTKDVPIIPDPEHARDPYHAREMRDGKKSKVKATAKKKGFKVQTEVRDTSGMEYIQIVPPGEERTPLEWRMLLKKLVEKITKK